MFAKLRRYEGCSESNWRLIFLNDSDKNGWREGVIIPQRYVHCLEEKKKKKEEEEKEKEKEKKKKEKDNEKIEVLEEEIKVLGKEIKVLEKEIKDVKKEIKASSGEKREILCTDDIIKAVGLVYQSKYDGILFIDPNKVEDIAQIFRTYSLPCLLIVEVKGSELNDDTEEKILNALKVGVDYVAVNGELMNALESNKMKGDEQKEDSESDDGNESAD